MPIECMRSWLWQRTQSSGNFLERRKHWLLGGKKDRRGNRAMKCALSSRLLLKATWASFNWENCESQHTTQVSQVISSQGWERWVPTHRLPSSLRAALKKLSLLHFRQSKWDPGSQRSRNKNKKNKNQMLSAYLCVFDSSGYITLNRDKMSLNVGIWWIDSLTSLWLKM